MASKAVIYESLIIKSVQSDHGSAGVSQFTSLMAGDILEWAVATAPVGNVFNRMHERSPMVGVYKRSFKRSKVGSNGHTVRRTVYNDAKSRSRGKPGYPYASVIEHGRRRSHSRERFTWSKRKTIKHAKTRSGRFATKQGFGIVIASHGTSARPGLFIMKNALAYAWGRKSRTAAKVYGTTKSGVLRKLRG